MNCPEVFPSLADQSFYGLLASFAEPTAAPGGGSALALAAALAAALVERCANASHPQFTDARYRATELRRKLVRLAERDALVLAILADVGLRSQDHEHDDLVAAAADASGPPELLRAAAVEVSALAASLERHGAVAFRGEAHCAMLLADAAARAAESILALNGALVGPPH
jgi:formiminotetrahydrofolate cyclodeaminase